MKKFLNISFMSLVALSSLSLGSCIHNEVDDIFDEDAVLRLENAKAEYSDILTSNGGKWQMEYYSNTSEPGYTYVLTFHKDGTVDMAGHNKWINYIKNNTLTASSFGTMRSMWDVIGDNGLVLTFNSYNDYFHLFASPDAIPTLGGTTTSGGGSTAGDGHQGDYEFNLMKFSGDTVYMTGKKRDLSVILTRLPETTDDEAYLNEVALLNKNMFTSKLPYVYIVLPDGKRWIVKSASTGNMKIYPEGEDEVMTAEYHNFIITHDGMAFRDPLVLEGNEGNSYTIQRFTRQADGTALCVEDNKTLITADPLVDCLTNAMLTWKTTFKKDAVGGTYSTMATQISAESKKLDNTTLKEALISYNDSLSKYMLTLNFSKSSRSFPARYLFTLTSNGGTQMNMTFDGVLDYGERYRNACPTITSFLEALAAGTLNLSSASLLAPTDIKMVESANAENFIIWTLQ